MHVGIDISNAVTPRPTGVSRYIRCLVDALAELPDGPRLTLFCRLSRRRHGRPGDSFPRHRVRWLSEVLPPRGLDVFHAPDLRAPRRLRSPLVVTIHDLSAVKRDDHARRQFLERKRSQIDDAVRRADRIITHTEAVRSEIVASLGVERDRVDAIALADALPIGNAHTAPERDGFLLVVGGPSRRKGCLRVEPLLELLERRWSRRPAVVWVGSTDDDEARGMLADAGLDPADFRGHVSDAELDELYRRAAALLVLSESEGFCMPLLEAARRDCPVLALETPPVKEVLGDAAFWFREPLEANDEVFASFDDAEIRAERAAAAALRAQRYSWEKTARRTLECYRAAIG